MAKATVSTCYCTQCGSSFPVLRTNTKTREPGHLKKIFCLQCGKETNHAEVRGFGKYTYEDFLIEFRNGNFDEEGNRKMPWKQFESKYFQELNKKGQES